MNNRLQSMARFAELDMNAARAMLAAACLTVCLSLCGVVSAAAPAPQPRAMPASGASQANPQANPQENPAANPPDAARPAPAFSRPTRGEVASPAVLRAYLRTKDELHHTRHAAQANRFCFVKQAPEAGLPGGTASVWMIWFEGREIINRGDGSGSHLPPGEEANFLGRSEALAKSVNLATDVVDSEAQVAGSTYLVDRAWVDRLTGACKKIGRTVALAPPRPAQR